MNGPTVRVSDGRQGRNRGSAATGPTAGASAIAGTVSGAVLAAARKDVELTQEQFAERLAVAPATVQGWEQGTRPLLNVAMGKLGRLRRCLAAADANPELLRTWDIALRVDEILSDITLSDPAEHPLALVVPDRETTELLAWPITGRTPRHLSGTAVRLDVPQSHRDNVIASLRAVSDQACGEGERSAMLRRQIRFLLAGDPGSYDWIAEQQDDDLRSVNDITSWSPAWPLVRSAAVTSAVSGDLEPMRHFIANGLASDDGARANLNYWAYWVGESATPWAADSAMTNTSTDNWTGVKLLDSLLEGVLNAPYRDLCAHTIWALLRHRRGLLSDPVRRARVQDTTDTALAEGGFDPQSRRKLEQVAYTTEASA